MLEALEALEALMLLVLEVLELVLEVLDTQQQENCFSPSLGGGAEELPAQPREPAQEGIPHRKCLRQSKQLG